MTRTERAAFPRAIVKDRAESKTGLDKRTPKNGAGPRNWGSLGDERELEEGAAVDEEQDFVDAGVERPGNSGAVPEPEVNSVSERDIQGARKFRKGALKHDVVDLTDIARTSAAVATSPGRDVPITSDANTSILD